MKPNTILRLEQGLFIVAILVVVGLLVRAHSQTEKLSEAKGWAEHRYFRRRSSIVQTGYTFS